MTRPSPADLVALLREAAERFTDHRSVMRLHKPMLESARDKDIPAELYAAASALEAHGDDSARLDWLFEELSHASIQGKVDAICNAGEWSAFDRRAEVRAAIDAARGQ